MKPPNLAEDIVPIGEFKTRISSLLRRMGESRRPLVITQNGRATAVVLSPADYEAMTEREAFLEAVDAGLEDMRAGRVTSLKEVEAGFRKRFGRKARE